MSQTILDGINLKLVRAQKHVDELRGAVRRRGQGHEPVGHFDPERPHEIVVRVRITDPPDPYWCAILGDVIQNCRAVLDHVVTALVDAAGGNSDHAYFPIYVSREKFDDKAVPKLVKYKLPESQRTLIESVQPYNSTLKPATAHPAWAVQDLARLDRHRVLVTQELVQTALNLRVSIDGHVIDVPPLKEPIVLEDDAELARMEFFHEGTRDVRVQGRLQTRLYVEGVWPLQAASDGAVAWVRDDVVARFAPILKRL